MTFWIVSDFPQLLPNHGLPVNCLVDRMMICPPQGISQDFFLSQR